MEDFIMDTIDKTKRIAALNDELRRTVPAGQVFLTANLNSLGPIFVAGVIQQVRAFDDFNEDNDPHGEHDFGSFEFGGHTINWKIDCFSARYCVRPIGSFVLKADCSSSSPTCSKAATYRLFRFSPTCCSSLPV